MFERVDVLMRYNIGIERQVKRCVKSLTNGLHFPRQIVFAVVFLDGCNRLQRFATLRLA
jgi:hypothetical protein